MSPAATSSGKKDLYLVKPFIQAVIETIKTQCKVDITSKEVLPRNAGELQADRCAIFSVFSGAASVSVTIGFPEATYRELMKKMLGDLTEEELKAQDGIKEFVNIIFGKVKKAANSDGRVIQRGIPAVLLGSGTKVGYLTMSPPLVIPFDTSVGPMEIELIIENRVEYES